MKNYMLAGFISMAAVMSAAGIMAPAKAANDSLPVGTIIAWAGDAKSIPAGWMLCDGKAMNTAGYKDLYAAIGRRWGGAASRSTCPTSGDGFSGATMPERVAIPT